MKTHIRKCILLIMLFCTALAHASYAEDYEDEEDEEMELNEVRQEVREILSSEEGEELEDFAKQKLSPAIWDEVERRAKESPFDAMDALEFLSDVYFEYLEISEYNPDHTSAFLDMTRREIKTHVIGDKIIYMIEEDEGSAAEIADLKKQLRVELEALFDMKLQLQKRELEMLEREVEELREILLRRSKQRSNIIDRRFDELTGVDDPLEW